MINKHKLFVYFIFIKVLTISCIFSQSLKDFEKMQSEYKKFKNNQDQYLNTDSDFNSVESVGSLPNEAFITPYSLEIDDKKTKEEKYFGYDFFTIRDTVSFWENLPSPSNYLLGAGDELILSMWGQTQLRQTYTISREGNIYDDKVGLLNLGGRTVIEAFDYLKIQFGNIYSTLNGKNPSSFIDISLGELRSINVNFVGHVNYPGVYPIHPFSNLITGLIQSGGVDTSGSLRQIQIKRDGKLLSSIDMYDYFISGELSTTIQLRDQDIIIVPPRLSYVTVDSAVYRPGIYESLPNETIYDLIEFAGGRTYDAGDKIGVRRIRPVKERIDGNFYESLYLDHSRSKMVSTSINDRITVYPLFKEIQKVEIIGQVKVPGSYHYYEGMTLKEILSLSGGFSDTTFNKSIYLNKAEIIRRNPDSRYEEVITVNLNNLIDKKNNKEILLQNLDRVVIHENPNFFEKENILIVGEVNIPGSYPLIEDGESLKKILRRAGGLTSKALQNGIAIYRSREYFENELLNSSVFSSNENDRNNIFNVNSEENLDIEEYEVEPAKLRVAWQNSNIGLMPGDSIIVKEKSSTVYVAGAVYNPGVLEYKKGKSLNFYINSAGGLTELGNKDGIIILYPNGLVSPKKWYSRPRVQDGSTIIISEKIIKEPFNITAFATNWTSILSSMITVIVLSRQL
ncbi:hypothetical protein HOD02_03650 [bacterium]|jgi:protein involved in polysaccharide export with SLBB domain|nr:hypothetical protein [bacterium]